MKTVSLLIHFLGIALFLFFLPRTSHASPSASIVSGVMMPQLDQAPKKGKKLKKRGKILEKR